MLPKRVKFRVQEVVSIDMTGISVENSNEMLNRRNKKMSKKKKKKKQSTETQLDISPLEEFCSSTSMHGFRYITERGRHWFERLWWFISIAVSVSICIYVIVSVWNNWQKHPVNVHIGDISLTVDRFPFPAITICNNNKFDQNKINVTALEEKIYKWKEHPSSISSEDLNQFDAIYQICIPDLSIPIDLETIPRNGTIYKTIKSIAPGRYEMLMAFKFTNRDIYFEPIFTEEGICYTFNSLNSREIYSNEISPELLTVKKNPKTTHWTTENGYEFDMNESEVYPYRLLQTSYKPFETTIQCVPIRDAPFCLGRQEGFHVAIHAPNELPRIPDDFVRIQATENVHITVKPYSIYTTDQLRNYSPERRGCFFVSERKLRLFLLYTKRHCELECLAEHLKTNCKCVPFFMPMDTKTKVCTFADGSCLDNARSMFSNQNYLKECHCLPDCTTTWYDLETAQSKIAPNENSIPIVTDNSSDQIMLISKLSVSIRQPYFTGFLRSESNTMYDFFASCGGLLGLFMGISVLSVVELFYYFTLRLFCKFKQRSTLRGHSIWARRNTMPIIGDRSASARF